MERLVYVETWNCDAGTSVESPLAAKGLLRHSHWATTQAHYIKDVPSETVRAMEKIDALCNNVGAAAERLH